MSAKSIDKSIGQSIADTFCERIVIGIVDTVSISAMLFESIVNNPDIKPTQVSVSSVAREHSCIMLICECVTPDCLILLTAITVIGPTHCNERPDFKCKSF